MFRGSLPLNIVLQRQQQERSTAFMSCWCDFQGASGWANVENRMLDYLDLKNSPAGSQGLVITITGRIHVTGKICCLLASQELLVSDSVKQDSIGLLYSDAAGPISLSRGFCF